MKSLRSSGRSQTARAARRSSSAPSKLGPSVRIDSGNGAAALVGAHDLSQVRLLAQRAGRGRAALELGDDADVLAAQRIAEAALARGAAAPSPSGAAAQRQLALATLDLLARFGQDALEHGGGARAHAVASARRVPAARLARSARARSRRVPRRAPRGRPRTPSAIESAPPGRVDRGAGVDQRQPLARRRCAPAALALAGSRA